MAVRNHAVTAPRLEVDLLIAYPRQPSRPRLVRAFCGLASQQAQDMVKKILRQ